jgi:hypothetical protein
MVARQEILNYVFELVFNHLTRRAESLKRYIEYWHGTYGGIEGWLKVEFVAAISPDVLKVSTGSASRGKPSEKRYPDLLLENKDIEPIEVELKASTNWHLPLKNYENCVLFFLCGTQADSLELRRREIEQLKKHSNIAIVISGINCYSNKEIDFLFGFVDLDY